MSAIPHPEPQPAGREARPAADGLRQFPQVLAEELEAFGFPSGNPATIEEAHRLVAKHQPDRSALCISGGGIRSASFALGVVQRLAKAGFLKKFDYLSTVSGGGYLGSMLTAWRHAEENGKGDEDGKHLAAIEAALAGVTASRETSAPLPLTHVRRFSNYISPKLGLMSADTWSLVATTLRNLLLNWTVLVVFIAGVLMIPWLGPLGVMATPSKALLGTYLAIAGICFALGTAYPGWDLPAFADWKWPQRRFLIGWLLPMLLGMLSLATWWAGLTNTDSAAPGWMKGTAWGEGLCSVAGFVFATSGAGLLACMSAAAWKSGWHSVFELGRTKLLLGIAAVFCVGIPCSVLLWTAAAFVFPQPAHLVARYVSFGPPLLLCGFFVMNSIYVGLVSRITGDEDREWWARAAGWVLMVAAGWAAFHSIVFYAPCLLSAVDFGGMTTAVLGAAGGISGLVVAFFAARPSSGMKPKDEKQLNASRVMVAVALGFFALLATGVSQIIERAVFAPPGTAAAAEKADPDATDDQLWNAGEAEAEAKPVAEMTFAERFNRKADFAQFGMMGVQTFDATAKRLRNEAYRHYAIHLGIVFAITFAIALVMGCWVNVNRFSLHATYRNRLVRAFLGAARAGRRQPHPFTGFDPEDNIDFHLAPKQRLFHVVTMALNLVDTDDLAWQERMADSFTASPLHCGNHRIGYRRSESYGGGLSLGTAMAISGAAANPNQGYHSSPVLTLLMTIFNVRLGWWLGNPKCEGTWRMDGPKHALVPLLAELFGKTRNDSDQVQLSDGGHFDNMGLYEMVLRRCRWIVLIDAEQDGDSQFEGLGGTVRKIRIDLGIDITFRNLERVAKCADAKERCCAALGEIDYGDGKPGRILYIKPLLCGGESVDLTNYAASNPHFPHETTGDQFFSESQFESYRALGYHAARCMLPFGTKIPATFAELFATAFKDPDPVADCKA